MVEMETFGGYMFSKLHLIGSKSEGPTYFLQMFNYREIVIKKKVQPWKEDPNLQKFLAKKVTIKGSMTLDGINYEKIMEYNNNGLTEDKKQLNIDLKLKTNTLWVNKMPPSPQPSQCMAISLLVQWPYRSIWEGYCPSTQIYEFLIEHKEKVIWRWGNGKAFASVITPVYISGGDFHEFTEVWSLDPDEIKTEGAYEVKAIFIASGQEASKKLEIKFAS